MLVCSELKKENEFYKQTITFLMRGYPLAVLTAQKLINNEMTHEEKINYMRIASGIVGYGFDPKGLDMLVSLYELVIEKKGESDLKTISKIEAEVKKRADIKSRSELLDKVSKKVG